MKKAAITRTSTKKVITTKDATSNREHNRKNVTYIKAAISVMGDTKKAIITALRANGLTGNPVNLGRIQEIRTQFENAHLKRYINRANSKISLPVSFLPSPTGRPPIHLPIGTPAERLTALRKLAVTQYAQQAFRYGAPGGTSFTVEFAAQSSEVDYSVSLDRNYDVYRGAYKGWGANVDMHQVAVPADWRRRVECRGIALLGGLLTLDALPLECPDGIDLYAAVWANQGRGYDVKTERGFIAVAGRESFHGETMELALAGIARKHKIAKTNMAAIADMASSVEAFITKYSTCAIEVSLDDARKSGSCEYGIRSWCESVGIDIGRVHVSIAELLEAFRRLPLTEVRRAVLHAVRRNGRSCRGQ